MSSEYLTSTLRAPRGVTRVAGAKAYAAKLAASPAPTVKTNKACLCSKHETPTPPSMNTDQVICRLNDKLIRIEAEFRLVGVF